MRISNPKHYVIYAYLRIILMRLGLRYSHFVRLIFFQEEKQLSIAGKQKKQRYIKRNGNLESVYFKYWIITDEEAAKKIKHYADRQCQKAKLYIYIYIVFFFYSLKMKR